MSLYATKVVLEVNGQEIPDFKSFKDSKIVLGKGIKVMNKTGFIKTKEPIVFSANYVRPSDGTAFDFSTVADGTFTAILEDGKRIRFTGVYTQEIGEFEYDGEKEASAEITFYAKERLES